MHQWLIGNKHNFKHGHSGIYNSGYHPPTPEYNTWARIISRCFDKNNPSYERYGGRGITVFPLWKRSFTEFLNYIGPRPGTGYSIDRINNDGNYEPGNVKWSTQKEQCRNKKGTRNITYNGKIQCITAWAEEVGIGSETLRRRLQKGWTIERAIEQPLRGKEV